jgi:hypothetical protein
MMFINKVETNVKTKRDKKLMKTYINKDIHIDLFRLIDTTFESKY